MKLPLIPEQPLAEDEIEAAIAVLRSGRVTQHEKSAEFERVFAEAHGYSADRAVFCNSGSSANLLAVMTLDLQPGDEVIVPAVTWPTQVWPIVQSGGVPVLADVNPESLMLSSDGVAAVAPRCAGVFVTHLLGQPRTIIPTALAELAKEGLFLAEDCCEALGVRVDGKPVGTFGRFGTFSFYLSHHITTIEGGMVLCRDAQDADRLRVMRNHGMSRQLSTQARLDAEQANPDIDPRFLFLEPGYNLRGTDVAAAIGLAQWLKREKWAARRREIATFWTECLPADIFQPVKWAPGAVPFAFPLILREGLDDELLQVLRRTSPGQEPKMVSIMPRPMDESQSAKIQATLREGKAKSRYQEHLENGSPPRQNQASALSNLSEKSGNASPRLSQSPTDSMVLQNASSGSSSETRRSLIICLENAGIETRPILAGNLARQPAMRKVKHRIAGPLTGADILHDRGLYVGLNPQLILEQIEWLPKVLKEFKDNLKC